MGTGRIKKKTLRTKMLGILMLCAMTSLLAAGIVSYMALRMIQNDSIEDNMKMYLDQITRDTDSAYYDMLSIMNYMSPGGLIGNVTEKELRLRELEREKWRLNLMRLKNGRRAFSSFADTYLVAKCYDALLRDAEVKFEAGIAPLYEIKELQARRDEAELRLMEHEAGIENAAAKAAVESYRGKLSDEQLETLLAAEQRFFGPR